MVAIIAGVAFLTTLALAQSYVAYNAKTVVAPDVHPRAFLIVNAGGDIVEWGPDAQAATGWAPSEIIGRNFFKLMPPQATCKRDFAELVDYNVPFQKRVCSINTKDGGHVAVSLRFAALEPGTRYLGILKME